MGAKPFPEPRVAYCYAYMRHLTSESTVAVYRIVDNVDATVNKWDPYETPAEENCSPLLPRNHFNSAWLSNHMISYVCGWITFLFPNFNGATAVIWSQTL